jgi:hypothetical protein
LFNFHQDRFGQENIRKLNYIAESPVKTAEEYLLLFFVEKLGRNIDVLINQ